MTNSHDCTVVGFVFDESFDCVLLIEKSRPKWQKGSLNGIGGKVCISESPYEAMIREFDEEVCSNIKDIEWKLFCTLYGVKWKLFCFYAVVTLADLLLCDSKTDECVGVYEVRDLPDNILFGVPSLILFVNQCIQ